MWSEAFDIIGATFDLSLLKFDTTSEIFSK